MVSKLELHRKKVELMRVSAAKGEMELRIHERLEEIERVKESIAIQEAKEIELTQLISEMQKEADKA